MDKKNTTIGVLLLLAAVAVALRGPHSPPPTKPSNAQAATESTTPSSTAPSVPLEADSRTPASPPPPAANGTLAAVNRDAASATVTKLGNDYIEARFTNFGGAVLEVAFKKYPAVQGQPDPYIFNHLHENPLLALTDYPGLGRDVAYQLVSSSPTEVVYRTVLDGKIEVTRRYTLAANDSAESDPYRLQHETTFRNLTNATATLPRAALSLGTATLLNDRDLGQYLSVVSFDGNDPSYIARGDLSGGGIGALFGAGREPKSMLEKPGALVWGGVKNQFFASIYTAEKPGMALIARQIDLTREAPFPDPQRPNIGLTGAARFDLPALPPNGSAKLAGALYVGPQEYRRLAKFVHGEDRILPYSQSFYNRIFFSRYVAPFLNILLNTAHSWVGNWGVAVVVMTLILKIVSLPFTLAASRSAKRMAKLQPELQAAREKYKDNPQKQQLATMELFKTHKVNPVGGCIPVLITFPLFIGFFAMLQCTAELRFAPFLWAKDLAAPDTVGHLFGIAALPINIMPLLMGATMLFQMRLTPQPSVDNAQAKMMKFMPVIFILFCYSFSCALALYSTVNGLFTIGQQLIVNRMKDPVEAAPAAGPGGKPMKNVTPTNKKLKP